MSQSSRKGTPNMRWPTHMSECAILALADFTRQGQKVDKGFKQSTYQKVADLVNSKFGSEYKWTNVYYHYRTLKTRLDTIQHARNCSGVGGTWDSQTNTISMDEATYKEYIAAHPKAEKFINAPIRLYEELALICGNDRATGEFFMSSSHPPVEVVDDEETGDDLAGVGDDLDGLGDDDIGQSTRVDAVLSAPSPTPQHTAESSKGKRRKRVVDEVVFEVGDGIGAKIDNLTNAIDKYVDKARPPHLDDEKIFAAVMGMAAHGTFLKEDLFDVYYHLVDNERDARKFMGGNAELRLRWLTRHLVDQGMSQASTTFDLGGI